MNTETEQEKPGKDIGELKAERTADGAETERAVREKPETTGKRRKERKKRKTDQRPWEELPVREETERDGTSWKHLLLSLTVMCALSAALYLFRVPNPNILLITGLAAFTSLYGYGAGLVCGAVMLAYSMFFFSTGHNFVSYTALNLAKMASITLGVALNILFIGRLKRNQTIARQELLDINRTLRQDNTSLERASLVDDLTGTRNRLAFRRDYSLCEGLDIHVLMFDLDDFKSTNDTYGHAVGDYVLRHTGEYLRDAFGERYCYRYGGDEFLVVRPDMEEAVFSESVETVRARLAALSLEGRPIPARFSAGYVWGRAELSVDLRLMLRQADHNLYAAKEQGKCRASGSRYSRVFAERLEKDPERGDLLSTAEEG